MTIRSITASSAIGPPGHRNLLRNVFRFLERRRAVRRHRADLYRLAHLSDHALNDIGLTREQVSVRLSRHLLI